MTFLYSCQIYLYSYASKSRGCFQRETRGKGPYAGADYNYNAATHTRKVSSAGGKAASSKGEARKGRSGRPHPGAAAGADPEAADPAAGAAGDSRPRECEAKTRT